MSTIREALIILFLIILSLVAALMFAQVASEPDVLITLSA